VVPDIVDAPGAVDLPATGGGGRVALQEVYAGVRRLGRRNCLLVGRRPAAGHHPVRRRAGGPARSRRRPRQRGFLLICLAEAAGLAGDEERAVAYHRELAALTEAASEFSRRWSSAWSLWGLWAAAWCPGDLDRAIALHQQSLRLHCNDRACHRVSGHRTMALACPRLPRFEAQMGGSGTRRPARDVTGAVGLLKARR
jgi:hypothetical protein